MDIRWNASIVEQKFDDFIVPTSTGEMEQAFPVAIATIEASSFIQILA
jgi:hypothetical protein